MNLRKSSIPPLFWLSAIILGLCLTGCLKNLTVKNIVYENTFSDGELSGLKVSGWNNGSFGILPEPRISIYNGNYVLGKLNNNIVRLVLNELPRHDILRIEVELYLHNGWKNDLWKMECDGETRILTGFSNDPLVKQSYPNWLGNGSPLGIAGTNAKQTGMPGICNTASTQLGSSAYTIVQTFGHTKNDFTLQLSDAGGNVNDTCNRSWSIQRLTLSVFHN
jgi:hypothetical protein